MDPNQSHQDTASILDLLFLEEDEDTLSSSPEKEPKASAGTIESEPESVLKKRKANSPEEGNTPKESKSSSEDRPPGADLTNITGPLKGLIQIPIRMLNYFNSGDIETLLDYLERVCDPQCTLMTSTLREERVGIKYVKELFASSSRVIPDIVYTPPTIKVHHGNIVSASCFVSGTKNTKINDPYEDLYCICAFGPPKNLDLRIRRQVLDLISEGKSFTFKTKITFHLIPNEDLSKIVKFIMIQKPIDAEEAPVPRTFDPPPFESGGSVAQSSSGSIARSSSGSIAQSSSGPVAQSSSSGSMAHSSSGSGAQSSSGSTAPGSSGTVPHSSSGSS
jgi:hypothetical protein